MEASTTSRDIPMDKPIILYDGVCNFCNSSVQFTIKRDPAKKFRFASLQSETGKQLLKQFNLTNKNIDSTVLIEGGKAYTHSTVGLRIARELTGAWPLLYPLIWIPASIRDVVYNWIARNRYRWFGKSESCQIPDPATRTRFIDI